MIDIALVWDAAQAIKMARRFEEFNLFWLEEPLPPDDLAGYAKLADTVDMRIAAGEEETTYQGLVTLAEQGRVDVLQPDVARAGGLTQCMRVGLYAFEHNILCVPHAFSTGILVAASLHLAAGMPRGRLTEFMVSDSPFARELLAEPFRLEPDGTVRVPQAPGLDVALNEEVLRRYAEVPVLDVPGRQV